MSHAKITLRPPPNVDYVQGFPGIPPNAPDRPQAAVRGTIELRLGSEPVKAKWVRIELRKVETLPGGGQANTFYDHVGQSPLNVWAAREDYDLLQTQDFPFYIRIPESVPPSINLEKGASIHYELVASVCLKGKKGLLRRSTSVTLSTTAPVIIDKHELHSTWPIYAQPDTRHVAHDALRLSVDRTNTCFGPGDRVACTATLRSDSISTVVLRAFEFSLKETTVWRGNPHSKKGSPQVTIQVVGEEKQAINATLYGGTQHKADLACVIPSHHCVSTVTAARHIDVTYTLHVTAIMASGQPLMLTLPVMVTNWTRHVSIEAIRRIGMAPSLSPGVTVKPPQSSQYPSAQSYSTSASQSSVNEFGREGNTAGPYGSMPSRTGPNDFGVVSSDQRPHTVGHTPGAQSATAGSARPSTGGSDVQPTSGRRIDPIKEETTSTRSGSSAAWLSSEAEKRKLYERARKDVQRVQGLNLPSEEVQAGEVPAEKKKKSKTPWATSEEEKKRLYDRAQAQVRKTQAKAASLNGAATGSKHSKNNSLNSLSPSSIDGNHTKPSTSQQSAGASTSAQLMTTVNGSGSSSDVKNPMAVTKPSSTKPSQSFPTAEEEKARLRYEEAKQAVAKNQPAAFDDSSMSMSASSSSQPAPYEPPPPGGFVVPGQYEQAYGEKERLRRAYAEQDAAAIAGSSSNSAPDYYGPQNGGPSGSSSESPPSFAPTPGMPNMQLLSEKEQLRKLYDAQDAAALAGSSSGAGNSSTPVPAGQPFSVPVNGNGRALSEKERLQQWYEQQDALASSLPQAPTSPSMSSTSHAHVASSASAVSSTPAPASGAQTLSEKERLQKWYAEQDALASSQAGSSSSNYPASTPSVMSPPLFSTTPGRAASPPIDEKERLRQWHERQDAIARGQATVSRTVSTTSTRALHNPLGSSRLPPMSPQMSTAPLRPLSTRPQPAPPIGLGAFQPMSAAEEKARLQARLDQEARARTASTPSPSTRTPSPSLRRDPTIKEGKQSAVPPPPLMPRPPREYINETRREDARSRAMSLYETGDAVPPMNVLSYQTSQSSLSRANSTSPSGYGTVPAPPPLPPKIPIQ